MHDVLIGPPQFAKRVPNMKLSRWSFVLSVAWFFGVISIILFGIFLGHWTHHLLRVVEGELLVISDLEHHIIQF
jgi:hypothetical protein